MKKALVLVLVVGFVAGACLSAQAQEGRRIAIEPRISYWIPDDADNAVGFGVQGKLMVSDWFGLVAGIDFWGFEGDSLSTTLDVFPDWDISDLSLGIVFYIGSMGPVNPYFTAGIDYLVVGDDFGGADVGAFATPGAEDTLGWHVGGGVDIALGKNVSIVIEGRYFDTSVDADLSEAHIDSIDVTGLAILAGIEIGF
jgi:hypothetical protein